LPPSSGQGVLFYEKIAPKDCETGRTPLHVEGFVSLRDLFPTLIKLAGAGHILTEPEEGRPYWTSDRSEVFYCYDSYHGRQFKLRGIRTTHLSTTGVHMT